MEKVRLHRCKNRYRPATGARDRVRGRASYRDESNAMADRIRAGRLFEGREA
jgi:hypothetical protein